MRKAEIICKNIHHVKTHGRKAFDRKHSCSASPDVPGDISHAVITPGLADHLRDSHLHLQMHPASPPAGSNGVPLGDSSREASVPPAAVSFEDILS